MKRAVGYFIAFFIGFFLFFSTQSYISIVPTEPIPLWEFLAVVILASFCCATLMTHIALHPKREVLPK